MELLEELELVSEAKKSLHAFDKLYDHYMPKIYAYVLNRTGQKQIAEDITSQTFTNAMLNIQKFNYQGVSFGAWLYKLASNCLADYFRKHKEAYKPVEEIDMAIDSNGSNEYDSIENRIMIINALKKLSDESQKIISLKYFEELDNEDVADIIGCKKGTLAVKLHRSLEQLKDILKKEYEVNI